jgi:hypothetical protein
MSITPPGTTGPTTTTTLSSLEARVTNIENKLAADVPAVESWFSAHYGPEIAIGLAILLGGLVIWHFL